MAKIRYSFVVPYFNRPVHFHNSLVSLCHHYKNRTDIEYLVLEDKKNVEDSSMHAALLSVLTEFSGRFNLVHMEMPFDNYACPCSSRNLGVSKCAGKVLILTNPEVFHVTNIFDVLDKEFCSNQKVYVACACMDGGASLQETKISNFSDYAYPAHLPPGKLKWKQHSKFMARSLPHCAALRKEDFIAIGGFNEEMDKGVGAADVDLVRRIRMNKIVITPRDEALTVHIRHGRTLVTKELVNKNKGCHTFRSMFV